MPARIDDLTCCRAVFALWVFLYHLNLQLFTADLFGPLTPLIRRGYLGVDAFFMLSGLVLAHAHPHLGLSGTAIRGFWLRRFTRIYPVHFAVIILLALLLAAGTAIGLSPREPGRFGAEALLHHLLLVHGWGASESGTWNYPSWSISTEWAGYLAFPVLWAGMRSLSIRQAVWALLPLLAALTLVELAGEGMRLNLAYRAGLGRFVPEFLAGMALARAAPSLCRWRAAPHLAWTGALWAVLAGFGPSDSVVVAALFAVLAGLVARAGQGRGAVLARLPGFVFAGILSYSFYMSFAVVEMLQAVLWRAIAIAPTEHAGIFGLSTVAATFLLSLLLWRGVERPGQSLLHLAARPSRR